MSKLTLISSATASGSASVDFTSGIDSTYDEYVFYFVDIHPSSDSVDFQTQFSTNAGSSYGMTITSTFWMAHHNPSNGSGAIIYQSSYDLAQSTSNQTLFRTLGDQPSESCAGEMHLFSPSSTSKVKHFYGVTQGVCSDPQSYENFSAGYVNDASNDIDAARFTMSSGNIDAGTIYLFGVS